MPFFHAIVPHPCGTLGATWEGSQLSFGLYTENASEIDYFFYANPYEMTAQRPHPLLEKVTLSKEQHCFGGFWSWKAQTAQKHTEKPLGYLIRVWKIHPQSGQKIARCLTDPWARESAGGEHWGCSYNFQIDPQDFTLHKTNRHSENFTQHPRRLAVVRPPSPKSKAPRPHHPWERSILYECHVRGMTQSPSARLSHPAYAGTYRGLVDQIPYLKKLGITALQLLPIFDFDETENRKFSPVTQERLYNYWGYSPLLFFAPKQNYAFDRPNPTQEFKAMVEAFHQANLEIILDVVYNHTAELDEAGPIDHFKWLGQGLWYLQEAQTENNFSGSPSQKLSNLSGCGNALNCTHPIVKQFILASLRYWVHEMGVDGFRFDLTSILNRDPQGHLQSFPALLWEIRHDPALAGIKLIAEPWDAAGGYQLGHFAHHAQWSEWNDRYRNTLRQVLRGDEGKMADLKQRLMGSPDIFQSSARGSRFSLNLLTAHDGMTLWDLVSYNQKNNVINGEGNRDGCRENFSHNCGIEGDTQNLAVQALRQKKVKTFHLLLQLSHGIPMLMAGDEWGRTQKGNNNAYCLDSPLSWLDWNRQASQQGLVELVQKAIAFRQARFSFLFSKQSQYTWYNSLADSEDLRPHIRTLMWKISHPLFAHQALCCLLNGYDAPLKFQLPPPQPWHLVFNTAAEQPSPLTVCESFQVEGFSLVVLESHARGNPPPFG